MISGLLIGFDYLWDHYVLIGGETNNTSGTTGGENSSGGGEGKPNKPGKPNLTIKVGPQTDADKDTVNLSNCFHKVVKSFEVTNKADVKETLCDFSSEFSSNNKPIQHPAFDYVGDKALLCDQCHAVICKNCYEENSSVSDNG